jgi:regulator of RNase E activity RraA
VKASVDLARLAQASYSAAVSDICDQRGYRMQTLAPSIRAAAGHAPGTVLVGWARTVLSARVDAAPPRPYGTEIDFIDSLRPGDVVVADCSQNTAAFWGELFSTAARARGARGAVIDGLIRDSDRIAALSFPVFATGYRPTDSLGRVSIRSVDEPVEVGGVTVRSGDLVIADADGVVIVPAVIAAEVAEAAMTKARVETDARSLLKDGALLADVWERYKVL